MLAISFGEVRLVSIVSPSCTPVLGKTVCTRGRSGTARRCRHQISAVLDLAEDTIFALSPSWLGGATGDIESAGAEWEVDKAGGEGVTRLRSNGRKRGNNCAANQRQLCLGAAAIADRVPS
jgi:hypothetical protein